MLMLITSVCVLFVALSLTSNSDEPVYRAVGDEVVLTPGPVSDPITRIIWRHGQGVAMEWFNGFAYSVRQFKERGDINRRTGALTITGLTPGDSGSYTAEINNKVTRTTQLLVISRVSKPTVSKRCDPVSCVFTCESDTTNAEPVTYSWKSQEKSWDSRKELRITNEESETLFHCELSNPVSTEISETVQNPFSAWKWYEIGLLVILPLLILCVGVFICCKIRKKTQVNPMSTSATSLENSEEKEALVGSSQDQECDVSSETRRKEEVCGESNQGLTADVDPESSSQTDIRASPDQVLTDATSEAEETSVVPNVPASPSEDPPVQEQAADLTDET